MRTFRGTIKEWIRIDKTYLLEPELFCVFTEASSANHKSVLPDQSMSVPAVSAHS